MKVEIDPDDTRTVQLDDRGRGCLGVTYANKEVEVVVLGDSNE